MEFLLYCVHVLNFFSIFYLIISTYRIYRKKFRQDNDKEKMTEGTSENLSLNIFIKSMPTKIKIIKLSLYIGCAFLLSLLAYQKIYLILVIIAMIFFAPILKIIVETTKGNPNFLKNRDAPYILLTGVYIIFLFFYNNGIDNKLEKVTSIYISNNLISDLYKIFIFGFLNGLFIFLILLTLYLMLKDLGDWFSAEVVKDICKSFKTKNSKTKKAFERFQKLLINKYTIYLFYEVILFISIFFDVIQNIILQPIFNIAKKIFLIDNGYFTAMLLRFSILSGLVITFLFFKYDSPISSNGMEVFELLLTVLFIPIIYSNIIRFRNRVTIQTKS